MTTNITSYIHALESELLAGNATEHTHRPALKTLVEVMAPGLIATNEPRHVACGAPDFVITKKTPHGPQIVGYIETKDVGVGLDQVERSEQLGRYLAGLRNMILTDYLEFRWYVDGQLRQTAHLGRWVNGKLIREKNGPAAVSELIIDFLSNTPEPITSPQVLAVRMARLAHLIRDSVVQAFERSEASETLQEWRQAFAQVLIADLDQPYKLGEFADMFAQTLAYGLFSARIVDHTSGFDLREAQSLIPKTNPFLRKFFFQITGPDLEDEPFASYVEDLVMLLDATNMDEVMAHFGRRDRLEDPVVHFYETFLRAYDPNLRELRGVYFTPLPVVSFIVKSVDHVLKKHFKMIDGLASISTLNIPNPDRKSKEKTIKKHKVLLLDPATGTGTFLYEVINYIRRSFMERNDAGMWASYVREHILPRLFGFELLMAPYAVAHFKLALELAALDLPEVQRKTWAYNFMSDDRLNVFLTNTLEPANEFSGLPLLTAFLADETRQAGVVKQNLPIMVIVGNPPYSGQSSNKGNWIRSLVRDYYFVNGQPLGEKNPKWLQDDYVKFIRWAQWRIEQTGSGVLGFISNHGYLDNPTFRGMRQCLIKSFDEIYVLDLHGNTKKKETTPDGGLDKNVFDIQQGVAIGIFIKKPFSKGERKVYHADLWGSRETKYQTLSEESIESIKWQEINPSTPFYLFTPQNIDLRQEYDQGWRVNDIFPVNSVGIVTGQDANAIGFTMDEARNLASQHNLEPKVIKPLLYRPFDERWVVYDKLLVTRNRYEVMQHFLSGDNLGIITARSNKSPSPDHFLCSRLISEAKCGESTTQSAIFPLYIRPDVNQLIPPDIFTISEKGFIPNLNPSFIKIIENITGLEFINSDLCDLQTQFGPKDIFQYIYSIFYSPTYRNRYAEFLKIDFPHIPLTTNVDLFRNLCGFGGELVDLHLLETTLVNNRITSYPIPGDNLVEKGHPRYIEALKRVYINRNQYFEDVPQEVWNFHIGGYPVLNKWLTYRRGRQLTYEDLEHFQKVVVALYETIRVMTEIDEAIIEWPIT